MQWVGKKEGIVSIVIIITIIIIILISNRFAEKNVRQPPRL